MNESDRPRSTGMEPRNGQAPGHAVGTWPDRDSSAEENVSGHTIRASLRPPNLDPSLVECDLQLDDTELTLVIGPSGYGKTNLLTRWYRSLRRSGARPIWLTIEDDGVEPADLERLLHHGLGQSRTASIDETIQSALDAVDGADRVLFVDNIHHLGQRVIDQLLEWFTDKAGPQWRLVMAGLATISIAPPRGRPAPTVRELGPDELRLKARYVDGVLQDVAPDLAPWQRSELVHRIDGWPAGLDLVRRVLATDRPTGTSVAELVDGHPIVAGYFEREVLNGLAPSNRDFLMWSSVVARPEGEACDEISRVGGGADRLARLARINAFVRTTPDGGYSWVPMGRAVLLARLRTFRPGHEQDARRQLLHWLLAQRRYDEAMTQAAETDDWPLVVDLVLDTGLDIIGSGRAKDLIACLNRLPAEVVQSESGVAVVAAMALWASYGDLAADEIERWLQQAASARRGRSPCQAESLSAAIDAGRAAFGRMGPRTRRLLARRALRVEAAAETPWAAMSQAAAGLAAYLDDDTREARRTLTESLRIQSSLDGEPRRCVTGLFSSTALGVLALIELQGGGYDNRADALVSAAHLQSLPTTGSDPGAGIICLAKSRAALAAGDHQRALELALETARTAHVISFQALGYLDAASIHCERGRAAASMRCVAAADRLLEGSADVGRLLTQRRRAIEWQVQLGRAARGSSVDLLTEREVEVLRLLDTDLSRREIAKELYLSFETVKTYVQRLYQKLGVSSRAAAVATAEAWGWLDEIGKQEPNESRSDGVEHDRLDDDGQRSAKPAAVPVVNPIAVASPVT